MTVTGSNPLCSSGLVRRRQPTGHQHALVLRLLHPLAHKLLPKACLFPISAQLKYLARARSQSCPDDKIFRRADTPVQLAAGLFPVRTGRSLVLLNSGNLPRSFLY